MSGTAPMTSNADGSCCINSPANTFAQNTSYSELLLFFELRKISFKTACGSVSTVVSVKTSVPLR